MPSEDIDKIQEQAYQNGQVFLDKILSYQMPTQMDYVNWLPTVHIALALLFFICGMFCLIQGWKIFKLIVLLNAAVLGAFFGSQFGELIRGGSMAVFCGVAGMALFSVLAWPAMKIAVSVMGSLAGGFLGYGTWAYIAAIIDKPGMAQHSWAGALVGFVGLGLMGFVIFKFVIIVFTSVQGSLMTVSGLLALLMKFGLVHSKLYLPLMTNTHLLVLIIAVPAVIGFGFQYIAQTAKEKKKKMVMESE